MQAVDSGQFRLWCHWRVVVWRGNRADSQVLFQVFALAAPLEGWLAREAARAAAAELEPAEAIGVAGAIGLAGAKWELTEAALVAAIAALPAVTVARPGLVPPGAASNWPPPAQSS